MTNSVLANRADAIDDLGCIDFYIHSQLHIYIYIYIYAYLNIYIYKNILIYLPIYIYIKCMHICIYIYIMCVCMYIYKDDIPLDCQFQFECLFHTGQHMLLKHLKTQGCPSLPL